MSGRTGVTGFDVFDTLVTRRTFVPVDAFSIVARRLADVGLIAPGTECDWARRRIEVERALRRATRHEEIRLDEIYDALARTCAWDPDAARSASNVEVEVERAILAPVAPMIAELDQVRRRGTAVLISDSYLSGAQLSDLLAPHIPGPLPQLFVSSERLRTKRVGTLFGEVTERIAPAVLGGHVGDNVHSDVRVPRARGIAARLATAAHSNAYERRLVVDGSVEASLVAGCARAARVATVSDDDRQRVLWDTGCDVIGPFIGAYVLWVLGEAARVGVRRLYFVARDGQVMLRLARHLARATSSAIECRYLHGSRQAWHAGSYDVDAHPLPGWLLEPGATPLTVGKLLRRLGFDDEEAARWSDGLDVSEPEGYAALLRDPGFRSRVAEITRARREALRDYLIQEGLADGVPSALVDIGWLGRAQDAVEAVLSRELGRGPLHGFYVGLRLPKSSGADPALRHGYVSNDRSVVASVVHGYGSVLEILCAADHGGVTGYVREGDRVLPQLRTSSPRYAGWGVARQQEGAERFVMELCSAMEVARGDWGRLASVLRVGSGRTLARFAIRPSPEEAAVYGAFPHEYDQAGETAALEFAPPLSGPSVRQLARSGWREATLARTLGSGRAVTAAQYLTFSFRALRRLLRST